MTLSDINTELIQCRKCARLVSWREQVGLEKRKAYRDYEYWSKPVPGFGEPYGRVFVVGLAPSAHDSNRTGRQFTGDASGDFLFPALFKAGFSSQPSSVSRADGLTLVDIYISAVCRCAPPDNKPAKEEIQNCLGYLEQEIELIKPRVFVALGRIAFDTLLRIFLKGNYQSMNNLSRRLAFSHNAIFQLDMEHWLLTSYHPSRQNTQTGKLTPKMFDAVWESARDLLNKVSFLINFIFPD